MSDRLQQLMALRARLDLEIKAERARILGDGGRLDTEPKPKPSKHRPPTAQERLCDLGVTALEVKRWALSVGLITEIKRGRIGWDLVDAYAANGGGSGRPACDNGGTIKDGPEGSVRQHRPESPGPRPTLIGAPN